MPKVTHLSSQLSALENGQGRMNEGPFSQDFSVGDSQQLLLYLAGTFHSYNTEQVSFF